MKKFVTLSNRTSVATSLSFVVAVSAAAIFWITTGSTGHAQASCTVCHKGSQTLTFPCDSLDYRRHLDHGDPATACGVTPTSNQ